MNHGRQSEKIAGLFVSFLALLIGFGLPSISYGSTLSGLAAPLTVSAPTSTLAPTSTQTTQVLPTADKTEAARYLQGGENASVLPSPTATATPPPTAIVTFSGYQQYCEEPQYEGIIHCQLGAYQIIRIDPKNPAVRFETVLPLGYDREGVYGECQDVNVPDTVAPGKSTGPGCHVNGFYPGERIPGMAARYPGSVVAFNGDFFAPNYSYGAIGLTVKNGVRFDGLYNDRDGKEVQRSSLSISRGGEVRIGIVPRSTLPNPDEPWTWIPDPDAYYNTIGGLPKLVIDGRPVDLYSRCLLEEGWCPATTDRRARTAVGKTADGEVIVLVIPESWGVTLQTLAQILVTLGASEAINIDGGGSSQLWYAGEDLIYSPRHVAEGMVVFSSPK